MPVTPLTIECRAVAQRMADITLIGGNVQVQRKLVYEDSVSLYNLMAFLISGAPAPPESAPGGYYSVAEAQRRVSSVMEVFGNVQTHPLLIASAQDVVTSCDFIDGSP